MISLKKLNGIGLIACRRLSGGALVAAMLLRWGQAVSPALDPVPKIG